MSYLVALHNYVELLLICYLGELYKRETLKGGEDSDFMHYVVTDVSMEPAASIFMSQA